MTKAEIHSQDFIEKMLLETLAPSLAQKIPPGIQGENQNILKLLLEKIKNKNNLFLGQRLTSLNVIRFKVHDQYLDFPLDWSLLKNWQVLSQKPHLEYIFLENDHLLKTLSAFFQIHEKILLLKKMDQFVLMNLDSDLKVNL